MDSIVIRLTKHKCVRQDQTAMGHFHSSLAGGLAAFPTGNVAIAWRHYRGQNGNDIAQHQDHDNGTCNCKTVILLPN
jgi:hypothetical protein